MDLLPCKGRNCGCTDGRSHSDECKLEHDAACLGAWISWEPPNAAPDPAPLAARCVCCDAPAICTNPKVTTEGGLCWEHSGYIAGGPWDDAVRVALEEVAAVRLRSPLAPDAREVVND